MPSLSYGLNITKKPGASKPAPTKRKPIFGADNSDEEESGGNGGQAEPEEIGILGDGASSTQSTSKKPLGASAPPPAKPSKQVPVRASNLASALNSSKHSKEAQSLDASIYDYDASYDALHPPRKSTTAAADDASRKPKYMSNLLEAAEVRKRDQLRAKDKLLVKEREAEGDEFADKEKFVTGAYKAQQEEMRRLEAEERVREEAERKKAGSGMGAFYRGMLEKTEKKHEEAVKAVEEVKEKKAGDDQPDKADKGSKDKTDVDQARDLRAKGRDVMINDEGQVVDKRQLLSAGLNVAPRPKPKPGAGSNASSAGGDRAGSGPQNMAYQSKEGAQRAQRDRQTRMLEEQLMQSTKRAAEEQQEGQEELERASKSRKTEKDIGGAKERYLARKREREQEEKEAKEKKKGGGGT
ncbi:MAG: hypothetical protein M4579_000519 [Chaenotheca gracillima]|nr:MAG: hypothetical protein M4579_000519 [Chaenotheca gracillima]